MMPIIDTSRIYHSLFRRNIITCVVQTYGLDSGSEITGAGSPSASLNERVIGFGLDCVNYCRRGVQACAQEL